MIIATAHSPLGRTSHKAGNGVLSITCRNRHCPKCQANTRDRWLQARRRELLPTPYVHVVFTLPHRLAPLALQNKKLLYNLLFQTCAETLLEVARDPKHLGAEIGFFSVAPHLESEAGASSPSPLRGSGRWPLTRSSALDPSTLSFLSPQKSTGSCLPRQ